MVKRTTPLARKTPLRSVGSKVRRTRESCSRLRCNRAPVRGLGLCRTHAKIEADRLFSLIIRSRGHCARCRTTTNLQCAHIVSRRYLSVRWKTVNAFCLCAKDHTWFTHNPLEWELWVYEQIGCSYDLLKKRALEHAQPDYSSLIPALRAQLAAVSA